MDTTTSKKSLRHPDRTVLVDEAFRAAIVLLCAGAAYRYGGEEDGDAGQDNLARSLGAFGSLNDEQKAAYRMICSDLTHAGF